MCASLAGMPGDVGPGATRSFWRQAIGDSRPIAATCACRRDLYLMGAYSLSHLTNTSGRNSQYGSYARPSLPPDRQIRRNGLDLTIQAEQMACCRPLADHTENCIKFRAIFAVAEGCRRDVG